jgi:hypothetical protein
MALGIAAGCEVNQDYWPKFALHETGKVFKETDGICENENKILVLDQTHYIRILLYECLVICWFAS